MDEDCVVREAHTSTTLERPGLRRLKQALRQRQVTHLIVDKVDRMTREGMMAAYVLLYEFEQIGRASTPLRWHSTRYR